MSSSVFDYYRQENLTKENEKNVARLTAWIIVILSVVLLTGLVMASVLLIKKKNRRIAENIEIERQMRQALECTGEENDKIRKSVRALLTSRFRLFDDLCKQLYPVTDDRKRQILISSSINALLKEVKEDGKIVEDMESLVDEHCSNLMTDFNKDFPSLGKTHRRIFLYTFLGFSDSTIAEFLGKKTTGQIHEARRYLKNLIKKGAKAKSSHYLSYLSRNKADNKPQKNIP